MPTIKKITKLNNKEYKVVEQFAKSEETSIVDKEALVQAIKELTNKIAEKNELLAYKKNLLKEINKI